MHQILSQDLHQILRQDLHQNLRHYIINKII